MEENKKDTAPETEAPKAEATPAGETPETEKKEKKDKKFFHKEQKELEAAKAQLARRKINTCGFTQSTRTSAREARRKKRIATTPLTATR